MTRDAFLDALGKYADEVSADFVELLERRCRQTIDGAICGEWMTQPMYAKVHRTVYIPYDARARMARHLGLVLVPDAMTDHVHPLEGDGG